MMINFSVKNVIEYPGNISKSFDTFRSLKSSQWSQKEETKRRCCNKHWSDAYK